MFRRTKPEEAPATVTAGSTGGKGHATPTRREAQAAARARARGAQTKKEANRQQRERRAEQGARMRQAMKTGDERYLPARDRGPVRRFLRDLVDSRMNMAEFLLPLLVIIMLTNALGYRSLSDGLWAGTILLVLFDTLVLVFKVRRDVGRRFPDQETKGSVFYAVVRSAQMRFLRMPKPQVKIGQKLPARY